MHSDRVSARLRCWRPPPAYLYECMRKSFSTMAQIPAAQMHSQGTWLLTSIESPLVDISNTLLQHPPKHLSFL